MAWQDECWRGSCGHCGFNDITEFDETGRWARLTACKKAGGRELPHRQMHGTPPDWCPRAGEPDSTKQAQIDLFEAAQ